MQDADGPADVQALSQPTGHRRPRVELEAVLLIPRSENVHGIAAQVARRRDRGQDLTVRATEAKLAVGLSIELIAFFVDGAVMPAAEQGEIRERGGASI